MPALYSIYLFISTTVVSSKQHMQITMYCIFVLYLDLYYKNEVLNHSQVRITLKYICLHFINWKYIVLGKGTMRSISHLLYVQITIFNYYYFFCSREQRELGMKGVHVQNIFLPKIISVYCTCNLTIILYVSLHFCCFSSSLLFLLVLLLPFLNSFFAQTNL